VPRTFFLLGLVGLLLATTTLRSDHLGVRAMCAEADAIVLARVKDGDVATVERWLLPPTGPSPPAAEIRINQLEAHSRNTDRFQATLRESAAKSVPLPTDRFVAFLESTNYGWRPLSTFRLNDQMGSEGMIWIHERKCWAYLQDTFFAGLYPFGGLQSRNPYISQRFDSPSDENTLLNEIKTGLAEAKDWQTVLAEPDPRIKAEKLTAYTLTSTSPAGGQSTFFGRVPELLRPLESDAVPAVIAALERVQSGDDPEFLLRSLLAVNGDFRPATPALLRLLLSPAPPHPYLILAALGKTRDPRIIPCLQPFLLQENDQIRETAQSALAGVSWEMRTPAQLVAEAPLIAVLFIQEASSEHPASARVHVRQTLKGDLPGSFRLEHIDPAQIPPFRCVLAFLRQNESGRIVPLEGESLKEFHGFANMVFWNTHWIPLEKVAEAIHPGQTVPIDPNMTARRARLAGKYR
jgi:hypothetical protein